jgi:catalase
MKSLLAGAMGLLGLAACSADAPPSKGVTGEEAVSALEGVYGVHRGQRRNHTKGFCALGNFVGLKEGSAYSRSALFSGGEIPVVARFSIAGGDPTVPDADRSPRGMALEFRVPGGSRQHMTMINTPMFFAAMPREFLDRMLALKPDPATGKPNPDALKQFAASHPDAAGQAKFLTDHNPPTSFANSAYFGIHTFKFVNNKNQTTLVKWRFVPQDGEKQLTAEQMKNLPNDFLEPELVRRMKLGPVRWDMWLTIGERGDTQDNPTILWPEDRKHVKVGTLMLTSVAAQPGAPCVNISYDPLVMADGIAATNDPVLLLRSPSYAASFARRMAGK